MAKQIERLAILMAMQSEADPLIARLGAEPAAATFGQTLPFVLYRSQVGGQTVYILVSGRDDRYGVDNIGTQAATLMAHLAISHLNPDLVISAGTAGGFSTRGAEIGCVYLSDREFVFHDRWVPLPGFDEAGVGHYPALNVRRMARDLGLPYGIISSGSSLRKNQEDLSFLDDLDAVAKEMEAAAIAWVCWLNRVPMMAVKSVTNLLDQPGESEKHFVQNLRQASSQLEKEVARVLDYTANKALQDLAG